MKRIFIGLEVKAEPELIDMISSFKDVLKDEKIRWTDIGNLHLTVAFLGDTEDLKITAVRSMLREKCEGSGEFGLVMKGVGVFRNLNDPRILWAGFGESEQLKTLNYLVSTGLTEIKISTENKPFNPHLTLGRIKHLDDKKLLKELIGNYQEIELQKVPVKEVILYESILGQSGPKYQALAVFHL